MYHTYVLYSVSFNRIYIGQTEDLHRRLEKHNSPENTGWSKRYQPWALFYIEDFATRGEALRREKELKTCMGRTFIWNLVKLKFPES